MGELRGFMPPRSPEGHASIVPGPPWHYSGDLLTIEYRSDPSAVAELLPAPLEPAPEDPGAVAFIFADWQSCSASFEELLDPVRSQYREAFVVVRCSYRGELYSRCVYIWVDKDFALARGWHQGYPKKLGSIWITRPVAYGKAGPRLEPGGRFGATLSVMDRRVAEARVRLTAPAETSGFVNALPMLHHRYFPSIEPGAAPSMNELVTMKSYDWEGSPVWAGDAELTLHESPVEELTRLAPREMIGGYHRSVGVSWGGGTLLAEGAAE
ncbi:MAG TPA: acetoacetate decarboxylase family protein [Actinomycetota bacterium]|nr:acetoacetate decarboxylase family protein [Actinomycetota bacterium]